MSQYNANPNIPFQPCPVCGANSEYRTWAKFVNSSYTHMIRSKKYSMMGSTTTPLVCTQCGYVQLFVDPVDFRDDQLPQ